MCAELFRALHLALCSYVYYLYSSLVGIMVRLVDPHLKVSFYRKNLVFFLCVTVQPAKGGYVLSVRYVFCNVVLGSVFSNLYASNLLSTCLLTQDSRSPFPFTFLGVIPFCR